jgi:hypothetical protein
VFCQGIGGLQKQLVEFGFICLEFSPAGPTCGSQCNPAYCHEFRAGIGLR